MVSNKQKCSSGRYKYLSFHCLFNEIEHITPSNRYLNTDSGITTIKTLFAYTKVGISVILASNIFSMSRMLWITSC